MKQLILFIELGRQDKKIQYVVGENAKDLTTFRNNIFYKLRVKLSNLDYSGIYLSICRVMFI